MGIEEARESVITREAQGSDEPFIFSTWLKGLRYGNRLFEEIPAQEYYAKYHRVIEHILSLPETRTTVCCLESDPDTILGYCVHSADGATVHWAFIKKAWRSLGLSHHIVPSEFQTITHTSTRAKQIITKYQKRRKIDFNPFI